MHRPGPQALPRPPRPPLAYRVLIRAAHAAAPVLGWLRPKWREGTAQRAGVTGRLAAWAAASRDPSRPLLWVHAASAGECLSAAPVLRLLREAHPEWQTAATWFSPSGAAVARSLEADVTDVLPWDIPADVDAALDTLRPAAIVFSRLDLWPELAARAAARGIRIGIVAATVSPGSRRLRRPVRALARRGYEAVTAAGAVSGADAERLSRLGVPRERIEVTGDPRFDSAMERGRRLGRDPLYRYAEGVPTLVAGSTWPGDERRLLPAFADIRRAHPEARLILAPHEPAPDRLDAIVRQARAVGLPEPVRLSAAMGPVPFLLVDSVGLLHRLYHAASLAYVGGGFRRAGVHSVLEPAASGLPVLFGPRWRNSREAGLLLDAGAAIEVEGDALRGAWAALLEAEAERTARGRRAAQCVEAGLGASARSAGLVERLMHGVAATGR